MSMSSYSQEPLPPEYILPPSRRTGLATTSLVLGLLSILTVCICIGIPMGFVALVLGIVALANAAAKPERYGGKGRAIVGIVTGSLTSVLLVVGSMLVWVTGTAAAVLSLPLIQGNPFVQVITQSISGVSNLDRIAKGLAAYQSSFGVPAPTVEALIASGLIPASTFGGDSNSNATAHAAWIADVTRQDPADWIIAYTVIKLGTRSQYLVMLSSGEIEYLDEATFAARLDDFKQAYKASRGKLPTIMGTVPEPEFQPADGVSDSEDSADGP